MSNSTYILDDTLLVSSGTRFLNYIIDLVSFFVVLFAIGIVLGILTNLLGMTALGLWVDSLGDLGWNLVAITVSIIYYTVMEGLFGRSVGKFITGSVVVDENGEKPSFGTIFKRSLCRYIPFDAFTFLGGSRGWHDSISDTYVVSKKGLDESVKSFHDFNLIGVPETELI
ncbi:RDD family protein [Flavobacterium sp. LAR06]|uniref:RDD family protein n=1 Tax=Flavobacterium sp. LAR06 TaxID=3064897 RepID=UPI0035C0A210